MPEQIKTQEVSPPAYFTPDGGNSQTPPVAPNLVAKTKGNPIIKIAMIFGIVVLIAALGFAVYKFVLNKGASGGNVTLVYWGLFEPVSVMQQTISEYETAHPGVKIKYSYQSMTQYKERLQQRLSSTTKSDSRDLSVEVPDIFRIHQTWVPMFLSNLSPMPATVYDSTTFDKTFYPSAVQSLKIKGQYYGIPLMYDGLALFYNEDLFKAKGLTPPKDWAELKDDAIQLTARDGQGKITTAGIALGTPNNVDHWSDILGLMLLQSGVTLTNPSYCSQGTGSVVEVCPGADALSFFTNFAKTDRVWDSSLPTSTFAFAKGDLAMYFGPSWRVFDIEAMKTKLQSNLNYKIIPVPQLPNEGDKSIAWATFWIEGVNKKSKYQAEAWEFLKYLSSKEVMQKLFQTENALRPFGEPFSRVDMASTLENHPMIGPFIKQAPFAQNWYLSSSTNDNGINDKIIKYYEDAVNNVNAGGDPKTALTTTTQGISQILTQYGVAK